MELVANGQVFRQTCRLVAFDRGFRVRLVAAMSNVKRLAMASSLEVAVEAPNSADAKRCLSEYFRELSARFETGFDPAKENSAPDRALTPPAGFFVVARLEGKPVGCGGLKRVDAATGEIKRLWVASSARRMGIARRILRTLETIAHDVGLTILRLDVNRSLQEALNLYLSEGYRQTARFNDNPYAHDWLEKRL
jgi:GNAT superfamily N-acetyltransferase